MNKYEVIEPLGEGSFGRVYKAIRLSSNTFVAFKVIGKRGRSAKEVKGLRRECEIQRRLDHPNIIKMLDSFETENEIVVITEFAHKELNTILGKEGYLSEERVQPIVWDLVSALYYLHSHRVLHRDLKPQNILIDSDNRAKLCDFGFARNMSTGTHVLTSIKGTPLYMAPELIEEQPYDHNADLWSLGCIIYELLVGAPPFCTASILHLIRLIRHEQVQWPTFISDSCISFLKGLLQKNPSKRLSWSEILNHPFVKGHILILEDTTTMPLTRALSESTLQAKEQQKKEHVTKVGQLLRNAQPDKKTEAIRSKDSAQNDEAGKSDSQDLKNNNLLLPVCNKMSKLSLDDKKTVEDSTKSAGSKNDGRTLSQFSGRIEKLNLIEDNHPIEIEEWIVFLQKSMEEIVNGEMLSLTQPNLTNIIVSPLRNSHASPKVLSYVAKLLSLPFALKGVSGETLQQIKKVYLGVKLVPNLVYSSKLLLRVKEETSSFSTPTPSNTPTPIQITRYKNINELTDEDLHCLEHIYMLITHLVHLENDFLSQLCDAVVILNVYSLWRFFLLICKNKLPLVMDLIAILSHILRIYPENIEILEKIVLMNEDEKPVNFVELLRHNDPILRERACFFLMFLGKHLAAAKMNTIWNETVRETLEALMYDSMESVRNAADRTVEELKHREFYKQTGDCY